MDETQHHGRVPTGGSRSNGGQEPFGCEALLRHLCCSATHAVKALQVLQLLHRQIRPPLPLDLQLHWSQEPQSVHDLFGPLHQCCSRLCLSVL